MFFFKDILKSIFEAWEYNVWKNYPHVLLSSPIQHDLPCTKTVRKNYLFWVGYFVYRSVWNFLVWKYYTTLVLSAKYTDLSKKSFSKTHSGFGVPYNTKWTLSIKCKALLFKTATHRESVQIILAKTVQAAEADFGVSQMTENINTTIRNTLFCARVVLSNGDIASATMITHNRCISIRYFLRPIWNPHVIGTTLRKISNSVVVLRIF